MTSRATTLMVVLVLAASACGGGGDTGDTGGATGDGMVGLLATLPDTADSRDQIILNDLAAVGEVLGIETPGRNATPGELIEYLMGLTIGDVTDPSTAAGLDPAELRSRSTHVAARPMGFNQQQVGSDGYLDAWYTAFGLSILDVDREATAGRPPTDVYVWEGDIDPSAVEAAVASDPVWSGDLNTYTHSPGYDYWCWGDDPLAMNVERVDPVRQIGRGGCLAAFEGTAIRTLSRESMQAALDVADGSIGSLADVEALRLAAEALDAASTYAAFLSMDVDGFSAGSLPELPDVGASFLDRYQAVGLGAALEADGTELLVVVFVYADDATAAASAATFETMITTGSSARFWRPWAEILTMRSIRSEGRVVIGVFDADVGVRLWMEAPMTRDTLILWD